MGSKSFDELAEQELFGRVLPKDNGKKPKLSLDVLPEKSESEKDIDAAEKGILSTEGIEAK
jgi:hypothetical protein